MPKMFVISCRASIKRMTACGGKLKGIRATAAGVDSKTYGGIVKFGFSMVYASVTACIASSSKWPNWRYKHGTGPTIFSHARARFNIGVLSHSSRKANVL